MRVTSVDATATVADLLEGVARGHDLGTPTASPARLPLGMRPLDDELHGGLRPGTLVTLAGRPGVGKTAITMQWARHLAQTGHTVVYACYEHDPGDLLERLRLADRVDEPTHDPVLRDDMATYGHRMHLLRGGSSPPGLAELDAILAEHPPCTAAGLVLVVDYLQRVPGHRGRAEEDRVALAVETLKTMALQRRAAVVAVVASDREGLTAPRLRLHHLRGSTAIAYESDVVLVLDEKQRVVSHVHLAYDPLRAQEFGREVVLTIEKNRTGPAPVDMEFRKDLARYRFHPDGRFVADRLVDERVEG